MPIKALNGKYGEGYHHFVTDKNPGDEYPYTISAAVVGDILVVPTCLLREKAGTAAKLALRTLREAEQNRE